LTSFWLFQKILVCDQIKTGL